MYIHNDATIDNVFESDFIDNVNTCIKAGDMVSFEVLSKTNSKIYNARYCSASNLIEFLDDINTAIINDGVCLVVKTICPNGKFYDSVYIVSGE